MFSVKRKWFRALFRRRVLVGSLILLQAVLLIRLVSDGSRTSHLISGFLTLLSTVAVLYIVSKKDKGAYKTTWVFLILSFPLFGGLFYLLFNFQTTTHSFAKKIEDTHKKAVPTWSLLDSSYDQAKEQLGAYFPQVRYLQDHVGFPIYDATETMYLTPGESVLEVLLQELEKAEHYIFLEFFIVQEGIMWDSILDILKQKAAQGVKVRLIYDDMGCFLLLPSYYPKQLEKFGIECVAFNPFRPFLTAIQNNRDHRKIISIDGKTVFTGGTNLADEYINAIEKHGHWKDAAIMLRGKAAWSFTLMFLEMWELSTSVNEDFAIYYPWKAEPCTSQNDGFVQPYADSPTDTENVGEHVYLQILNQAQDYVYITSPYLIVDDSMISALTLTAKRGVDVRIITPHRWDRWLVHMTTRSYYRELIKAGVKIYEYERGFIHSKTFVSDDHIATVGTTNLDFRSLYLHFECGALLFGSKAVMEVKEDFLTTQKISKPITEQACDTNVFLRLFQDVLRLFAPLM